MPLFPDIHNQQELDRCRPDEALWRPAVAEIARRHDLDGELRLQPEGSAVVFAIGEDLLVKIHEPWNRNLFATETRWLRGLHGRLPVAAPRSVAEGELEGWSYIVMTRLPGVSISQARERIPKPNLASIAFETGRLARAIQALPPADLEGEAPWHEFLLRQRREAQERHTGHGLPRELLEDLSTRIDADLQTIPPVPLHTELSDTNLLVDKREKWRLSGVFDFEPAMVGHPLYDLPGITIFVCRGDPELCAAAYAGFGVEPSEELRHDLIACTLLHRYSHIPGFLEVTGNETVPTTWREVSRLLFGL